MITLPAIRRALQRLLAPVSRHDCAYCRPTVDRYRVYVARGLRRPLEELWADLKIYD